MKALTKFRNKVGSAVSKTQLALVGAMASLATVPAFASGGGDSLATAMITKLGTVEADVRSVLVILVGVIGLFILYSLIKKARA